MGLNAHEGRRVQLQASTVLSETMPGLSALPRRVLTALLIRTAEGWHLFVRRDLASAEPGKPDAFLIGPGGVFAILIRDQPPAETIAQAAARHAGERCADIRGPRGQVLARSAIHLVVVTQAGGGPVASTRLFRSMTEADLAKLFRRDATHLDRRLVDAIVSQIADRLPEYHALNVRKPARAPEPAGLLDMQSLTADQIAEVQRKPFETWLTFLHPHQQAVVTRDYNGPARISGPAGTGKTVVALHRLRHLARRTTGPLLYTTFVRTLPLVHRASFLRLAPELADRVEFTNLHSWVRDFLETRGIRLTVNPAQCVTAFSRAWVAHRESLQALEPTAGYWQTEVDRVIKGRGVPTLPDYVRMSRKGRSVRLDAGQKGQVWQLYQTYQRNLAEKGLHDHNDMISIALRELRNQPLGRQYAAVVVDEVQDITLTGLRLLRELAGDGPNRLLLVGDGQQQVYAGGWRLSDAGIPIQGRGEVLRVNYRNRVSVLDFACRFDARNHVDDLDGAAGVALRDAESANTGGKVRTWRGPEHELSTVLAAVVRELPCPIGQTALIVFHRRDLDRCVDVLRSAGIPMLQLHQYVGERDDRLKVGTVHRAKGLDFQAVLIVQFEQGGDDGTAAGQEVVDLRNRQHLVAATRARDFLWWGTAEVGRGVS